MNTHLRVTLLALVALLVNGPAGADTLNAPSTPGHKETIAQINQAYVSSVKPIFRAKCFDCHSDQTRHPWYYKIPGVKQFIDHDVEEGREAMDFSLDYPFKSQANNLLKDLEELREVFTDATMPPRLYRLMHLETKLTPEDKSTVLAWVTQSEAALKSDVTPTRGAPAPAANQSPTH